MIAIVERPGVKKEAINNPAAPMPRAGYSLAIRAGDWIWCAGASPTDFNSHAAYPGSEGHAIAEHLIVDPNFWYGSEIENQAAYDLHKLELYLEAAGSDLEHVVKLQVYLTDTRDLPGLINVWKKTFGDNPPATTVVPIDKMGIGGSRVEINAIALTKDSSIKREVISTNSAPRPHFPVPQAIKAGPYVFLSGLEAVTADGIDSRAKRPAFAPNLASAGRDEMAVILENANAIISAAGGGIKDAVRVQVFAPDLREIGPALGPWGKTFDDDQAPTMTIVGTTERLVVPSVALSVDMTAYVP
jgi:enamine deaminase RidA (YjgF/YER057c/UK114 family)